MNIAFAILDVKRYSNIEFSNSNIIYTGVILSHGNETYCYKHIYHQFISILFPIYKKKEEFLSNERKLADSTNILCNTLNNIERDVYRTCWFKTTRLIRITDNYWFVNIKTTSLGLLIKSWKQFIFNIFILRLKCIN